MKSLVLYSTLALALVLSWPALAQTPDEISPSAEMVCDGLEGRLYGLCNAYCEAKDCDLDARLMQTRSCGRLLYKYALRSDGALPPCIDADADGCHDELDGCPGVDDEELCNVDSDGNGRDDACDCPCEDVVHAWDGLIMSWDDSFQTTRCLAGPEWEPRMSVADDFATYPGPVPSPRQLILNVYPQSCNLHFNGGPAKQRLFTNPLQEEACRRSVAQIACNDGVECTGYPCE